MSNTNYARIRALNLHFQASTTTAGIRVSTSIVCCGNNLFTSDTKLDSGTGCPSFWTPINEAIAKEEIDKSYGMIRTRPCVLGVVPFRHLFDDGPEPSCLRYCINSLSLSLERENESKKNTIE